MIKAGTLIAGKYRLSRAIGEGAMGAVWEAVHEGTTRLVAVKFIVRPTPELRHRLLREAKICGSLQHRNIVDVFDVGTTADGDPFLVMQLLTGRTLAERLGQLRRLPIAEAARVGRDVARALAAAHAASIIHRDLKPANIYLHDEPGEDLPVVKVLDFGVSKNLAASDGLTTVAGGMVGSPAYMSPEQAGGGGNVDARSDLWSLGVVLFEMLTGQRPFQGDSNTILPQILAGDVPLISRHMCNVDESLVKLVRSCIERELPKRIASAADLASQLHRFVNAQGGPSLGQSGSGWGPPPAPKESVATPPRPDPAVASPRGALTSVHEVDPIARSPRPQGGQLAAGPRMPGAGDDEEDAATAKLDPRMLRPVMPSGPKLAGGTAVLPTPFDPAAASRFGAGLLPGAPIAPTVDPIKPAFGSSPSNPRPTFGAPPAMAPNTEKLPPAPRPWGPGAPAAPAVGAQPQDDGPLLTAHGTVRISQDVINKLPITNLGAPPAPPPPGGVPAPSAPGSVLAVTSSTAPFVPVSGSITFGSSLATDLAKKRRARLFIAGAVIGVVLAAAALLLIRLLSGAEEPTGIEAASSGSAAAPSGSSSPASGAAATSTPPARASSAAATATGAPSAKSVPPGAGGAARPTSSGKYAPSGI